VKFKLDENLSPSLSALFAAAGHEAHSVVQQALGGQPDERVIDVCGREHRALVTLDLDFSNILTRPPSSRAFSCSDSQTKRTSRWKPLSGASWTF
jgi:predicted nuclease of predicted toxin-antitoxin system